MSPFRKTLHELRLAQERSARVRRATDRELGLEDGFQDFDNARGRLVELVETRMRDFCREAPGFSLHHGFYEGRYAVTLSADVPPGAGAGTEREFSRITFLLSPTNEELVLEVGVKLTVRNRDLPGRHGSGHIHHDAEMERLHHLVEAEMLRFAEAWFGALQHETAGSHASV